MRFGAHLTAAAFLAAALMASCSETDLAGTGNLRPAKKGKGDGSGKDDGDLKVDAGATDAKDGGDGDGLGDTDIDGAGDSGKPDGGIDSDTDLGANEGGDIATEDDVVKRGPCTFPVNNYNPNSVQCSMPVSGSNIWSNYPSWVPATAAFSDRGAHWISPLAPTSGDDGPYCSSLVQGQKLIYVSWFRAPAAGSYSVEALDDNTGVMRLWRNADPAKEVLAVPVGGTLSTTAVNLKAGLYSAVVSSEDSGVASAIVMSIKKDGNVVKHSVADGSWCIFQVPAATDEKTFVPAAAACRPCFTGP